ncbi:MAG: DUF881 domain-containing protein [Micrococcales bacterium]|nr:DUF881 domain-containing protein [Micrococcales bacterium]
MRVPVPLGSAAVGAVACLAGLLFVVSASDAPAGRRPQDMVEFVVTKAEQVEQQAAAVDALRSEVDALTAAVADLPGPASPAVQVAAGSVAVTGPGLVVTLDDAPATAARDDLDPDVLVVHQQDLQAVVNALWAGGAEAVAVQDQRIVATTSVQCVGNVLRLGGRVYSPPYTVAGIGDPAALRAALDDSPAVRAYQTDAQAVGLGWSVRTDDALVLPAYSGATGLVHAQAPPGTDVLGIVGEGP